METNISFSEMVEYFVLPGLATACVCVVAHRMVA